MFRMTVNLGFYGITLLYLLLLLPQMLWLLHSDNGGWFLAVCESCAGDGDTRSFVRTFMNRKNISSINSNSHKQSDTDSIDDSEMNKQLSEFYEQQCHDTNAGVDKPTQFKSLGCSQPTSEKASAEWDYASLCSCSIHQVEMEKFDDSAPNGGWDTPDNYPDLSGPCNIRRVEASSLTQREFELRFVYTEPIIITGLPEQLAFKTASTKYRLLKDFGHDVITVATANTHSYRKEKVTLCDYVEKMMVAQTLDSLGNETLYYFGDNNREGWSPLFSLYILPPYNVPHSSPVLSFGLAGPGTGVPFHIHGPTFAETLYGRKRWFLYPPGTNPQFHPDKTTLHWLTHTYPQLVTSDSERPLECTLNPGEVIYLPDKWWHATLNMDTVVFMSTFHS